MCEKQWVRQLNKTIGKQSDDGTFGNGYVAKIVQKSQRNLYG